MCQHCILGVGQHRHDVMPPQVSKVKAQMKDPRFNFEGLLGISTAAAGLFKWVAAMVNYHAVAKTVEPKRKKVAEAEKALRVASTDLAQTQAAVVRLSAELESLNKSLAEKSAEQAELTARAALMERRLAAASKLIQGLASERERWARDMQALDDRQVPHWHRCSACQAARAQAILSRAGTGHRQCKGRKRAQSFA